MTEEEAYEVWNAAWHMRGLGLDAEVRRRGIEFRRWWANRPIVQPHKHPNHERWDREQDIARERELRAALRCKHCSHIWPGHLESCPFVAAPQKPPVKVCRACQSYMHPNARFCPDCGESQPRTFGNNEAGGTE